MEKIIFLLPFQVNMKRVFVWQAGNRDRLDKRHVDIVLPEHVQSIHQGTDPVNGPYFLGTSTAMNYSTLSTDARLVTGSAVTSVLLMRGDHTGDAFCQGVGVPYVACTIDEVNLVTQWITLEGAN